MLNDVYYYKYHHHHHNHWQIPYQSVTVTTRRRQPVVYCASLKSEWRPIFSGARSFSKFMVQVVLMRHFGIFQPAADFINCLPAKLSEDHPLRKLWQRDRRNVSLTSLNEWCRQQNKLAWYRPCQCKLQSF